MLFLSLFCSMYMDRISAADGDRGKGTSWCGSLQGTHALSMMHSSKHECHECLWKSVAILSDSGEWMRQARQCPHLVIISQSSTSCFFSVNGMASFTCASLLYERRTKR